MKHYETIKCKYSILNNKNIGVIEFQKLFLFYKYIEGRGVFYKIIFYN